MKTLDNVHAIWGLMTFLTIVIYVVGEQATGGGIAVVFLLLITSLIKGGFIIRNFMELKGVSLLWRAIMYGWLWTVCIAIAVTYLMSI